MEAFVDQRRLWGKEKEKKKNKKDYLYVKEQRFLRKQKAEISYYLVIQLSPLPACQIFQVIFDFNRS